MKKWFIENKDMVIEKIFPIAMVIVMAVIFTLNFDPSEYIISADWLVG